MPTPNEIPNAKEIILQALKNRHSLDHVRILDGFILGEWKHPAGNGKFARFKCGRLDDYQVENVDDGKCVVKYRGHYVNTVKN